MTKKNNLELNSGESVRTSLAKVAFDQADQSETFSTSIRPNPPNTHYVRNQAQLETIFGTDLEIPDDTAVTLVIDESFVLTKPIKYGNNSSLELYGSTIRNTITYTGTGYMIQRTILTDIGTSIYIHDIILQGPGSPPTSDVFDIKLTNSFRLRDVQLINFNDIGEIDCPVIDIRIQLGAVIKKGFVIRNPGTVVIDSYLLQQLAGATGITLFSFIWGVNVPFIKINSVIANFFAGDSILYFPPFPPVGHSIVVKESNKGLGDLYQPGTDISVPSVADNGSGKARFTTSTPHNLIVGRVIELYEFGLYNMIHKVTAVDTPLTGTTFDIEEIDFIANDTGNMNAKSLDNTSPEVDSFNNPGVADSMHTGDAGLELAAPIIIPTSVNIPIPITDANWQYSNLERFKEDLAIPNQGRLIVKSLTKKRYSVTYSATILRGGGAAANAGITLVKNGVFTNPTISVNPPRMFAGNTATQISRTEIIELEENNVLQIAVINYDGAEDISLYQANLSMNRG